MFIWLLDIVDNETSKVYIMMEARITALFKKPEDFTILERWNLLEHNAKQCDIRTMYSQDW